MTLSPKTRHKRNPNIYANKQKSYHLLHPEHGGAFLSSPGVQQLTLPVHARSDDPMHRAAHSHVTRHREHLSSAYLALARAM